MLRRRRRRCWRGGPRTRRRRWGSCDERSGRERANERTNEGDDVSGANETNERVCHHETSLTKRTSPRALALPAPRPPPPPPPHPSALLVTTRPLSPRSPPSRPRRSSDRRPAPGASTRDATRPSFKASDGVGGVVERRRSEESKGVIGSSVETEGRPRGEKRKRARERKSSRIDAHHADAVVRGPV